MSKSTVLALTLLVSACERAPRSFVQPNVIKKADLQGTWYYLQTVTDAPPTSSFMFIGSSSELMKIKFDVQEDHLYARRAYEQIQGSEDAYRQDPARYAGQPVAAWPIKKHFDIIRDYNSTTGEETNKIIESEERPWNQREFIRVDWSTNKVTDYVGLGLNFFFDQSAQVEPVSYWESDPTKPDALHLERADASDDEFAKGEANYLDITNKMVVTPTVRQYCYEQSGRQECFQAPACFLFYHLDDCASQIVKVRHAFAKLSPTHEYEPRSWNGQQMNLFGLWDVGLNRLTYNRQYGVTNSGFNRHAARFNLWKKVYEYTPQGRAPIAYARRELRTIPYYAESSLEPFPPELFDVGKLVVKQWNDAVKVAVKDVTGADPPRDSFVFCHNPVKLADDASGPKDDDACKSNLKPELDAKGKVVKDDKGNPILHARQGDPRRSTLFWVNQQQEAGPLGYGPPLFDVETGEIISGQAYIYGAALDIYAARARDLVLLVLGLLGPDQYTAGIDVQDWVMRNRAGAPMEPTSTHQEVLDRSLAMDFRWAQGQAPEAPLDVSSTAALRLTLRNREDAMYRSGLFGTSQADLAQIRRDRLRGGVLEAMMVTPDVMAMGGAAPATDFTALTQAERARVSPLRSSAVDRAIGERLDKMRAFGFDFADFADEGIAQRAIQLANDPSNPNLDEEAIRQKLRKDIFLGIALHELGHNMGLRHNFRASFDSMNYAPDYWRLRTAGARDTRRYAGLDPRTLQPRSIAYGGSDCAARAGELRPRYVDCPGGATSVSEVLGGVREFQYSSVMDYGAEFNSDLQGLGHYDKAAIKFSYAGNGYVEVFAGAKTDTDTLEKFSAIHSFADAFGFPSPIANDPLGLAAINYTSYPTLFASGAAGLEQRIDVPREQITDAAVGRDSYRADRAGRPMVPYFFCSDEFVGNLTCQRFDAGADAFEQADDVISRYNNFYLLNNFKRDRYTFHTSLAYRNRINGRYLEILRQQLTWYTLLRADLTDFLNTNYILDPSMPRPPADAVAAAFFANGDTGWGSFTVGVTRGFDLLGQILSKPEVGTFVQLTAEQSADYPVPYWKKFRDEVFSSPPLAGIGLIDGKFGSTTWDFQGCGYYWFDECQTRIGYFLDKTLALQALTESQAYFTGRDTTTDVRKYAIGYILPFKAQLQEKLGALLAGDYGSLAPRFADASHRVVLQPSWTNNNPPPVGAVPGAADQLIDPSTGFSMQLYAGIYGLSSFPTTFDHSFIDSTRIFVVGNGEAPVPDSQLLTSTGQPGPLATATPAQLISHGGSVQWFIWTDVSSGKTYAAQSSPLVSSGGLAVTGPPYRNDTGVRMLETAAALQSAWQTARQAADTCVPPADCVRLRAVANAKAQAISNYRQNIDVMRSLHNAYGYATFRSDTPFYY